MNKTTTSSKGKRTAKTKAEIKAEEAAAFERRRIQKEIAVFGAERNPEPGALSEDEIWWRRQYEWLKVRGYLLRPRYAPEWIPSWEGSKRHPLDCEDGCVLHFGQVMDATHVLDGSYVSLKMVKKSRNPHEVEIGQYFMSEKLSSDPKNYCVPLLDVLSVPDDSNIQLIVMPLLLPFTKIRFDTFGEVMECLRQLFDGLWFMHNNHVAHRDCMWMNIMMDAKDLYAEPYHPVLSYMKRDFSGYVSHYTRTQRPPKYYFIDFGLSRRYDASEENPLEYPIFGGDKSVPEFRNNVGVPVNPFPTDVYYLGNVIREQFLITKKGFEFLKPLVDDMIQDDPHKRPTMEVVVERFESIRQQLSTWKLRSRVISQDEGPLENLYRGVTHWSRRIGFIVKRAPAVPRLRG
ncbi:hypothetical protein BDR07DRAFT_1496542 [Suillus spraguei]|nr:hypothetical protein BDR07DRAFT_1496542 [Suillus spraguei]